MDAAQLALLTIAQEAAGTLAKALPAIDLSGVALEDKLEFLADLSRAKHALDGFGVNQKVKALNLAPVAGIPTDKTDETECDAALAERGAQ